MSADAVGPTSPDPDEGPRHPYYCYNCGRVRELCPPFDGTCDEVLRESAEYQEAKANGEYDIPGFATVRLRNENEAGVTQQEMHKETIAEMKRTGREDQIGMKH